MNGCTELFQLPAVHAWVLSSVCGERPRFVRHQQTRATGAASVPRLGGVAGGNGARAEGPPFFAVSEAWSSR